MIETWYTSKIFNYNNNCPSTHTPANHSTMYQKSFCFIYQMSLTDGLGHQYISLVHVNVYLLLSKINQSVASVIFWSYDMSLVIRKPAFCICENKDADQLRGNREADQRLCFRYIDSTIPLLSNASVIYIPGSLGAGDSGDIAGPKCRDLTFDESRQCRRCAGVLISRQNANLCHILTTRGKLSLYICKV